MNIGVLANGPQDYLPDLSIYEKKIDCWIGVDRGALQLIDNHIVVDYAIGDFDSICTDEYMKIKRHAKHFESYPPEKDETDMELALIKIIELNPTTVYLFGVTGGRLDHTLVNIQALMTLREQQIKGIVVDKYNRVELSFPGEHQIIRDAIYPYVSFIPLTKTVHGITLTNFQYPLTNKTISCGTSLCVSNKLIAKTGTISYEAGILLIIKSRDV